MGGDVLNQRQIDLMKLLCEQNVFRPASFFSRKLSVSTKTVYSDFQDIEKFVKKFQDGVFGFAEF